MLWVHAPRGNRVRYGLTAGRREGVVDALQRELLSLVDLRHTCHKLVVLSRRRGRRRRCRRRAIEVRPCRHRWSRRRWSRRRCCRRWCGGRRRCRGRRRCGSYTIRMAQTVDDRADMLVSEPGDDVIAGMTVERRSQLRLEHPARVNLPRVGKTSSDTEAPGRLLPRARVDPCPFYKLVYSTNRVSNYLRWPKRVVIVHRRGPALGGVCLGKPTDLSETPRFAGLPTLTTRRSVHVVKALRSPIELAIPQTTS